MNNLIGLFRQYGLTANFAESRTMTFQPGTLRLGILEEARECNFAGVGDSYHKILYRQIPLLECVV